jgi:hypothetical protein
MDIDKVYLTILKLHQIQHSPEPLHQKTKSVGSLPQILNN